jgi:predicted ATP-binding protein involved in virulence
MGQPETPTTVPPVLPLLAFYGTGRLWSEGRTSEAQTSRLTVADGRLAGYIDGLSSSSFFKHLVTWYEQRSHETADPRFATVLSRNLSLLGAVNSATKLVLQPTGWCELGWDWDRRDLLVSHTNQGGLSISALSDGVRNMVALVADIARRCAVLNPHLDQEAARETPGILLIDEIDMHLHPRWQQMVVDLLGQAFPALQLVLTTHSPHVLSTVDKSSIRVIRLRDGRAIVETPALQTKGVMSADVLASIMGVDPIPEIEEAQQLSRYRALIEDGLAETEVASVLRSELAAHFGEDHPLMLDCNRLIRFQTFKLKKSRLEDA